MKVALAKVELFAGIKEEDIESLLQCLGAVERFYKKGETIMQEGKLTESIGVVLEGCALIEHYNVWGDNTIMGYAMPGNIFAEAYACIPNEPLMITVTAAEASRILFLNVGKILTTCSNTCIFHRKLIRNLLSVCAQKNLNLSKKIMYTSSKSIRGRLLEYFSDCIKKEGKNQFEIPFNRQQLADYLNVDRSAMCNELSKMQKEDIISYQKRYFIVKDSNI